MTKNRCDWCTSESIYETYHDKEWGKPIRDDRDLFEMLILEGAQAGLSWLTVLKRRQGYREVFDHFDVNKCAAYSDQDLEVRLLDPRIIRNRLKVFSVRSNAIAFIGIQKAFGSFSNYIWHFVDHQPIVNRFASITDLPARTSLSDAISKDLKKRGFTFVGSTIIYAYMQAVGLVNDHLATCFLGKKLPPVIFVGHGSPMNAIEDNTFVNRWRTLGLHLGTEYPDIKGIIAISAHWYTRGTRTTDAKAPKTIHDMYGFPDALYKIHYPAPGSKALADLLIEKLSPSLNQGIISIDNAWGIDHGTWSVLRHLFPKAQIPVVQLSIDRDQPPQVHFELGRALASLREEGYLIFGSGNVVHHLGLVDFQMHHGFPWAQTFDSQVKALVQAGDFQPLVDYAKTLPHASLAVPTPDHYLPLLYVLGAVEGVNQDQGPLECHVFNDTCVLGSISMTSYVFGLAPSRPFEEEDKT